jgi:amino acid transporter
VRISESAGPAGLRRDARQFLHTTAIGVAGTAPSYTIAASTAVLIGAVGALAPASLFYCGLIMVGITLGFASLNRVYPDAGASYEWVGRVFNRNLGFLTGWAVLVSSALFMVSAAIPAASATLLLLAPDAAASKLPVIAVSACWLVAIAFIVVRGTHLTGVVQAVITAIDLLVLAALTVVAFARYGHEMVQRISATGWLPSAFSFESFASGAVIALFFFWGWDVALNVSEETPDSARTPARAALIALAVIVCAFMAFALVTLTMLSEPEIEASGANVMFAIADKLVPQPWSYLAVLAVMVSSIGSLETCVLQFARTLFAQARAGDLHPRWSRVHGRWGTPHVATYVITALGLALLALALAFPDIETLLKASINALGLEVAFYYGLAALACAWHFRKTSSSGLLVFAVAWPLASALALWAAAVLAALSMDVPTLAIGIGGLAIGAVPLAWARRRYVRGARSPASR